MLIDQKGKLFGKISIIDILVIVILVAGCFGAYLTYKKVKGGAVLTENKGIVRQDGTLDTLEVRMRLEAVRDMTKDAIHSGDEVFAKDTGKYIGEVVRVETEPATEVVSGFDGTAYEAVIPDKIDVIMIVHVPGKRTDSGYFTSNNLHITYDSAFEIKTPTIQSTPVIDGIAVINDAKNK